MINWRSMVSDLVADHRGHAHLPAVIDRLARGSLDFLRRRLATLRGARG